MCDLVLAQRGKIVHVYTICVMRYMMWMQIGDLEGEADEIHMYR